MPLSHEMDSCTENPHDAETRSRVQGWARGQTLRLSTTRQQFSSSQVAYRPQAGRDRRHYWTDQLTVGDMELRLLNGRTNCVTLTQVKPTCLRHDGPSSPERGG